MARRRSSPPGTAAAHPGQRGRLLPRRATLLVALVALALVGCAGAHPPPVDPATVVVSPGPVRPGDPASLPRALVARVLRDAFGGATIPASIVEQAWSSLTGHGGATLRVPHGDHEHIYALTWVTDLKALVFFERTGDGVADLRAVPLE